MHRAGLAHGFVRFGTTHHWILQAIHDSGRLSIEGCVQALPGVEYRTIALSLTRLHRAGMIHQVGKLTARELGPGLREQWLYALEPVTRVRVRLLGPAEQERLLRARKRAAVASVFDFRGRISL